MIETQEENVDLFLSRPSDIHVNVSAVILSTWILYERIEGQIKKVSIAKYNSLEKSFKIRRDWFDRSLFPYFYADVAFFATLHSIDVDK